MRFSAPGWLIGGAVLCVMLVVSWYRLDKRQHAALATFVSPHLRGSLLRTLSVGRRRLRRGLLFTALALLFVALAGPQLGFRWEQTSRRGNEIVFAVDTSRSMTTPDVKPNRLARAKLAIDDFAARLDGDAVGLVAFAGNAFLACPITLDYGAFFESLNVLDTNTIPRGGTDIASAIREADDALRRRPGSDKILILVTDGEDLEGDALAAAKDAHARDGLTIFTIGVGTANGDLIPMAPEQGSGFVKDASGAYVKSRLDEKGLTDIATATGGLYAPLGTQGEGFDTLYRQALGPRAKHDLASRQQKVYTERYQWPVSLALAALLLSLCIGNRRRRPAARVAGAAAATPPTPAADTAAVASATRAVSSRPAGAAEPAAPVRAAVAGAAIALLAAGGVLSRAGHAAGAAGDARQAIEQYNAGTAAYRAGQFPQAAKQFQSAIAAAPSNDQARLAEQEDAYYNLGNTLYRAGQATEKSSPERTMQTWTDAVKAYETALQLRADDADSKYNRDLVKRKLAALQQQNPSNKPDPHDKDNKNKNDKNQDSKDRSGGGGQAPPDPQQKPPQGGQSPAQQPPPDQKPPDQKQPPPDAPQNQPGHPNQPPSPQPSTPPPGDPQHKDQPAGAPEQGGGDQPKDMEPREPGQMSREEARELLDSEKNDERSLGAPVNRADALHPPDKPVRDW